MAYYAPVAPLNVYRELDRQGVLGHHFMVIASEVLKDPDAWSEFFDNLRSRGDYPYIIVDNGLVETGAPLSIEQLLEAYRIVGGNVLVLPDVQRDGDKTVRASLEATKYLSRMYDIPARPITMGVVQGTTFEEAYRTAVRLSVALDVGWLAIPRCIEDDFGPGSREKLARLINADLVQGTPPHLLGASRRLDKDLELLKSGEVIGIDTAMPIWAGTYAIDLSSESHYLGALEDFALAKRPARYWSWGACEVTDCSVENVRWLQSQLARG